MKNRIYEVGFTLKARIENVEAVNPEQAKNIVRDTLDDLDGWQFEIIDLNIDSVGGDV